MATRASYPLWKYVPQLEYMQTPDRWLVITVTGTCLLVAAAVAAIISSSKYRLIKGVALAAAVMLNLLIGAHITTQQRANPERLWNRVSQMREAAQYTPIWWDRDWQDDFEQSAAIVRRGDASIAAIDGVGVKQEYVVSAAEESLLEFRALYFPGWTAELDGKPSGIAPSETGHIQLSVQPGEQRVRLVFRDTWPRTAGKIISAFSLIIVLALFYLSRPAESPIA
jgi:hypothetical protein